MSPSTKRPPGIVARDIAIGALSLAVIILGTLVVRDARIDAASATPPPSEQREGLDAVSVFEIQIDPESGRYIEILFDRPVVEVHGEILDRPPATLSPSVGGFWRWRDPSVLRFDASARLPIATEFTVSLIPVRLEAAGVWVDGELEYKIKTDAFLVERVDVQEQPAIEGKKVLLRGSIRFNVPVDPRELATRIRLIDTAAPEDEPMPVDLETGWTSSVIGFRSRPLAKTPDERKLELRILQDLTPASGNVPLAEDFTRAILLGSSEKLVVRGFNVEPGEKESRLRVELSSPIQPSLAEKYVKLEPDVDYRISGEGNALVLQGPLLPGQSYRLELAEDLPAADAARLAKKWSTNFRVPNLSPRVDFQSEGMFLPRSGVQAIALESVNVRRAELSVERIFLNNLFSLFQFRGFPGGGNTSAGWRLGRSFGDVVAEKKLELGAESNRTQITPIDLTEWVDDDSPGLYRLAVNREGDWQAGQRLLLITDLGIVAKRTADGFFVWATSVSNLNPVAGAKVTLISDQNQVLGVGRTDGEGVWQAAGLREAFKTGRPYLVTVERGGDFSFLLLDRMQVDTTGLDVAGAPSHGTGYTAFLYGERDLYRPGETVEGVAVLRDERLGTPPAMPLLLRHRDALGLERATVRLESDERGMAEFALEVPAYGLTGSHSLELLAAEEIVGRYTFQVEEFVPDRIKVEIQAASESVMAGESLEYDVLGVYLFGPPGVGLPVETRVMIEDDSFAPPGHAGFTFRDSQRKVSRQELLEEQGALDEQGRGRFTVEIPRGADVPASLRATVVARVSEQGGRGVTAVHRVQVHPYPYYVGLRRAGEGYAEPGKATTFEYVAVKPDGSDARSESLRAELYRERWNTVLRRLPSGNYRYESKPEPELIDSRAIGGDSSRGEFEMIVPQYGSYRLVLTDTETSASTSISFYASGWGYAPWALKNPSRVELELDQDEYRPGESAEVLVKAPFPGKLLLTVERDEIYHRQVHVLDGNTASLRIPVRDLFRPNAYVTATLIRAGGKLEPGDVARAYGAVPITVDRAANRLDVGIENPETVRSESKLTVDLVSRPGSVLTVSAVDEGILQLIAQKAADPFEFFYRKLALGTASFDTYSLLLPQTVVDSSATGGGEVAAGAAQYLKTEGMRRVEPVAFWSGVVETDRDGRATVSFDLPEFQGALRVTAVASYGQRFGVSESMVRVRDPIVVTPTFPRFLSFDEELEVPITVRNDSGRSGRIEVKLNVEGPARLPGPGSATVSLDDGRETTVYIPVETTATAGELSFRVTAEGNGERTRATTHLGVRADLPKRTEERAGAVSERKTVLETADSTWAREGTLVRELRIGPVPLVQYSGNLERLLRYPYGCLEQTTSTVFPLLYIEELAAQLAPGVFGPDGESRSAAEFVQAGIDRIKMFRLHNGAFALWPGGTTPHDWGTIYATHFLVEARRAGYAVDDWVYDGAIEYLSGTLRAKSSYAAGELKRAVYTLWVLARADRPELSVMDFVRDGQSKALKSENRAMLAAAYGSTGNRLAVEELLQRIEQVAEIQRRTGGNLGSTLRNRALFLLALLDADPDNARIPDVVDRLSREAGVRTGWTTQESAFALLALGQFFARQADRAPYSGTVYAGDRALGRFGDESVSFGGIEGTDSIRIEMDDGYEPGAAFFSLTSRGVPTDEAFRPEAAGLEIDRRYLDRDGRPLDLERVQQGDLIVIKLRVRSVAGPVENVVVQNLLPAGFEVENPKLETTETLPWVSDGNLTATHIDLRDDRILMFVDLPANQWRTGYALVRAVAPGHFRVPPAQVEAMYNGALRATGERGQLSIGVREGAGATTP